MAACDRMGAAASDPVVVDLGTSCGGRQATERGDCAGRFPEYAALLDPSVPSSDTAPPSSTIGLAPATED